MSRFARLSVLLFAVTPTLVPAAPAAPEDAKPEDFVLVQKGTLPIIVSAPHGGRKAVPDVPERLGKGIANFQTVLDSNTDLLAETFAAELEKQLDGKVWLVVAKFERKQLDANRPRELAYESEKAKPYYDAYHDALAAACKSVRTQHGHGLLLDIHGQGEFKDAICRGTQNGKTVWLLKERSGWRAITGKRSVLGHLERSGYKILPSCDADEKTKEEALFSGGHIVGTYGSHTGHAIDAMQLEFGTWLREKAKDRCAKTARDLADAVAIFHDEFLKDAKK
jgi:N-formylglutamate amidohydrolase